MPSFIYMLFHILLDPDPNPDKRSRSMRIRIRNTTGYNTPMEIRYNKNGKALDHKKKIIQGPVHKICNTMLEADLGDELDPGLPLLVGPVSVLLLLLPLILIKRHRSNKLLCLRHSPNYYER